MKRLGMLSIVALVAALLVPSAAMAGPAGERAERTAERAKASDAGGGRAWVFGKTAAIHTAFEGGGFIDKFTNVKPGGKVYGHEQRGDTSSDSVERRTTRAKASGKGREHVTIADSTIKVAGQVNTEHVETTTHDRLTVSTNPAEKVTVKEWTAKKSKGGKSESRLGIETIEKPGADPVSRRFGFKQVKGEGAKETRFKRTTGKAPIDRTEVEVFKGRQGRRR